MNNDEIREEDLTPEKIEAVHKFGALRLSEICWEYEDQLPEMTDAEFDAIFSASKVDGVRLYPFVQCENGERIWITTPFEVASK